MVPAGHRGQGQVAGGSLPKSDRKIRYLVAILIVYDAALFALMGCWVLQAGGSIGAAVAAPALFALFAIVGGFIMRRLES